MTIADYNLIVACIVLALAVIALYAERHSRSGSRYLLIIIVTVVAINVVSALAMYLGEPWRDAVRFANAALRSAVFILLLGYIIQRPRHVR